MAADGNREVNIEMKGHRNDVKEGEEAKSFKELDYPRTWAEREIYLQMELYADEENDSPEIKRKKMKARTGLTMWKEKEESAAKTGLNLESEIRSSMNEV